MTKRWNDVENGEKDEKDRKTNKRWEIKTWKISPYESRYLKKIWKDDKMTKRLKIGLKED